MIGSGMIGVDEHDDVVVTGVLPQPAVVVAVLGPAGEGAALEFEVAAALPAEMVHAQPPAHLLGLLGVAFVQQPQVELAR